MKILLVQTPSYFFSGGGASKANRLLLEGLAQKGHVCQAVAPMGLATGSQGYEKFLGELAARGARVVSSSPDVVVLREKEVEVHVVRHVPELRARMINQMREFQPTWTLVSEDMTDLLETALDRSPARVVYVSHGSTGLPFGPYSFLSKPDKTERFRQAAGIVTVSRYLQGYIRRWGGLRSEVIPFPAYGAGPFPCLGSFDTGFVTMFNPCAVKGISIFLQLAQRLPQVQFAAVPSWATTDADRTALERLPNVQLLAVADDVEEILAQTRILLVPSLWDEAFGLVTVDAMLRGIPVLASDVGGLPESKLGVDYLLPVRPIEQYATRFGGQLLQDAVVPDQDVGPWLAALRTLLADRAHYERLSKASREVALAFVSRIEITPFEDFLAGLAPASQVTRRDDPARTQEQSPKRGGLADRVNNLSPERLELLALRLRNRDGHSRPLKGEEA